MSQNYKYTNRYQKPMCISSVQLYRVERGSTHPVLMEKLRVSVCFQCFWVFPMFSGCFPKKVGETILQAISNASCKISGRPRHKSDRNSWYNLHTRTAGGSLERSLEVSSCGYCTRKFQEIVPRSRPQLSRGDDDKFFTTHSPGPIQTIVN